MKRICALLLATLMLMAFTVSAFASSTGTKYTHRDDGRDIPVYNDAGEMIFTIPNHKAVDCYKKGHGTRYVTYKGRTGWTHSYYLTSKKPKSSSSSSQSKSKSSSSSSSSKSNSSSNAVQTDVFSGMRPVKHYYAMVRPSTISNYVNIRWAPSKQAAIQSVRYYGDELRVIAENKTWAQVVDDTTNECGFIMKSFLERE